MLRAYAAGYRGCAVDDKDYFFFQCRSKGEVKRLKSYPKKEFVDHHHFILMMQKFVSPPTFLDPPTPISALTREALDRVYARMPQRSAGAKKPTPPR